MQYLTGIAASPGRAVGRAVHLRHAQERRSRIVRAPRHEQALLEAAVHTACGELLALEHKAPERDRDIFMVQRMMLADEGLLKEISANIAADMGAAAAVEQAAEIFAGRLRSLNDHYLSERACDVLDSCRRVVNILDGGARAVPHLTEPSILVAEEIYPTDLVTLERHFLRGFVTARGSVAAHASMIARTMGVPAVVMAGAGVLDEAEGVMIAMDGTKGEVYLAPDEATHARFAHAIRMEQRRAAAQLRLQQYPCVTQDGTRVFLSAIATCVEDVETAVSMGADAIGIFNTEYPLMAGRMNTEDDQYAYYVACLTAAEGRRVTFCTYDVGADKTVPGLTPQTEPNPALGLRGLRFGLQHKGLLRTQFTALLRAAMEGDTRILLPMVATPEELEEALGVLEEAKAALRAQAVPFAEHVPLGVMIEVPSAALLADELAEKAAFFHIGSNDLSQYTHAVDRMLESVQPYVPQCSRAVGKLVCMTLEAAQKAGIPCCLGSEGADPVRAEQLVRLGLRELVMDPRSLPAVKEYLMAVRLDEPPAQAAEALPL